VRTQVFVNPALQYQVGKILDRQHHFLSNGSTGASVELEATSTRDIAGSIRRLGGSVEADIRNAFFSVKLPATEVAALAATPGVSQLYPSTREHFLLDKSVPEIGAPKAWKLKDGKKLAVKGNHVVVGIVDTGIDYHNRDFQNANGTTRIKFIWDQTKKGHPPAGFNYGNECNAASINKGTCTEQDTEGHGTSVAGVAAGNGRSSTGGKEVGVASKADIIMVKVANSTAKTAAAWEYIIARAKRLHEAVVINNSFGSEVSPHDGTSPLGKVVDLLAGPGKVFVAAAGNEGNQALHADGSLQANVSTSVRLDLTGNDSFMDFAVFYDAKNTVSFTLRNVNTGETFGPLSSGGQIPGQVSTDGDTHVSLFASPWDATRGEVYGVVQSETGQPLEGHFSLDLNAGPLRGGPRYDTWIDEDGSATFVNADESDTVDEPGDGRHVIAVGNYTTRVDWPAKDGRSYSICDLYSCLNNVLSLGDIVQSSSLGPTADGRQKPEISAPGAMIISSLSRYVKVCQNAGDASCVTQRHVTPDGKNIIEQGTSLSAPHIAGVVALMLQVNPKLDYAKAVKILMTTARHDLFTGTAAWTPTFGAGKVDAFAAVKTAMASKKRNDR
jgi:subtilisin family serine protease